MNAAASVASPAICLDSASKRYPLYGGPVRQMLGYLGVGARGVPHKLALDGISLRVGHGERVGVVGCNGSGKTTLLRVVCGFTQPSAGRVVIDGSTQALMHTGYGFNDDLTGLENIRNALVYNGLPQEDHAGAEADITDFVELGEFLHHPVKTYSLGMRTRLEFAAATAIRPGVLAIDEVLGAGDGYFVRKCAERMRRLVSNTTLLLVSHSLDQIREYCGRAIWLDGGRLREDGPTDQVLGRYRDSMAARSARIYSGGPAPVADPHPPGESDAVLARVQSLFGVCAGDTGNVVTLAYGDSDAPACAMETGEPLSLRLTLRLTQLRQPVVLGFSASGALVFELEYGPALSPGEHELKLQHPRLGVGVGNYLLVAALREPGGAVLALGRNPLELQMTSTNWSDPPLLHLDGQWVSGEAHKPINSKVSAWV